MDEILVDANHGLPPAVEELRKTAVPMTSTDPPATGTNSGMAFDMAPIDEGRLAELLAGLSNIGFMVQFAKIDRRPGEFTILTLAIGQTDDPRVGK